MQIKQNKFVGFNIYTSFTWLWYGRKALSRAAHYTFYRNIWSTKWAEWVCARFNLQTKRFDGAFKDRQIAINGHSLRLVHIKFNYLGSTNYFVVRPNQSRCCFYHETIENQIKLRPFRLLFQPMVALEICLDKSTALINIRLLHLPTHTLFPYQETITI